LVPTPPVSSRSETNRLRSPSLAPTCPPDGYVYREKCGAVFEHFYESYPERDAGVYGAAA
jgi:hypothetical protein